MKKLIVLLLCGAVMLSASACSNSDSSAAADSTEASASQETKAASEPDPEPEPEPQPDPLDNTPLNVPEIPMPDLEAVKTEYAADAEERAKLYEELSSERFHPIINITTEGGAKVKSRDEYVAAVIDVFNCDEQYKLSAAAGVKVRGNSSANDSTKPYRIKFEEKQNLLGLHGGEQYKSWVLLRSNWNLVPDYMMLSLARAIFAGEYYSSDFCYVNVYLNGKFRDVYLLLEQNQANRLGINEPKEGETGGDIGYFVEIDNYPGDDHPFFTLDYSGEELTDIEGESRVPVPAEYSIKSDIYTQGQLDLIERYITGVWKIVHDGIEKGTPLMFDLNYNVVPADGTYSTVQEAVEAVLDTKSVANMLILEELCHNYDIGEGSFYMTVDLSPESSYTKLTFLAPWDFNWAYEGTAWGKYYASTWQPEVGEQDRSNPWFIQLMKADWFVETVKARWNEIGAPDTLLKVKDEVSAAAEETKPDLGDEPWRADSGQDIVKFVNQRILWLDKKVLGSGEE